MTTATLGVRVDSTTTAAEFTPGELAWVGGKAYVYIQANGIITGDGYVVSWKGNVWDAAMVDTDTAATVIAGMQVGVVECAFADNEYGWAQVFGACGIRTEQDALANSLLGPTADAGQIDDAGASANLCDGLWLGTATGGADAVNSTGFLNWPQMKDRYTPA
jgi:hypothetical protein